jgi:hypothetical protein
MSESYAGIVVPEGDPGAMHASAHRFAALAHSMSGVSSDLGGLPGMLTSWQGPASVNYAGACFSHGRAADAGGNALLVCAQATDRFATALQQAQQITREAIKEARDAQKRIDQAKRDIEAAQGAEQAASGRIDAAAHAQSVAAAAGVPHPTAGADLAAAQQDLSTAQDEERRARRALHDAEDDLERAKKKGRRAMQDAADAATAASGAYAGNGPSISPALPGAAAGGTSVLAKALHIGKGLFVDPMNAFDPSLSPEERQKLVAERLMDGMFVTMDKGGAKAAKDAMEKVAIRAVIDVKGYWRSTPSGGRTWVKPYQRQGKIIGYENQATEASEDLERLSRAGRFTGPVLTGLLAGADQYMEDSSDPDLTQTDKVGRAVGVGTATATGAVVGAEIGGTVGSIIPGAGTVVGGGVGAFVGGAAGAASVTVIPGIKSGAAWLGQQTANGVVDLGKGAAHAVSSGWDDTAGVRHTVAKVVEPWNW